jgi:dTDP-4-dehydrorhamnose reductase
MKVLVTGTSGQLGFDVMNELKKRGHEGIGADRHDSENADFEHIILDITDRDQVLKAVSDNEPDAIVHCAAWTNVDGAEEPENLAAVRAVNVDGTKNLADAAKSVDAKMVYISTDYVFSGEGDTPWQPDQKDYAPLNVYGQSKLDGELAVANTLDKYFIVRIAWVFGQNGKNFIKTMLKVAETHDEVRVVDDQIGTPTYTIDLARLLVDMIETEKYGYYHATNEGGYISWADFTKEIYAQAGVNTKVIPVTTAEYGLSKAKRPYNSRLDKSKLKENGFEPLPTWQDAVKRFLANLSS